MATDEYLRHQCQSLLLKLKQHQSELKGMMPSQTTSSHLEPSTNFYDHRGGLKPEYARDKLRSVVKFTDNTHKSDSIRRSQDNNWCSERTYSEVREGYGGNHGNRNTHIERCNDGNRRMYVDNGSMPATSVTNNESTSLPSYSARYMTTPNTRRKRQLIDRNVHVDSKLDDLDLDTSDRLNFSYSHIGDDDMTFLKSALRQTPEEVFQDLAATRLDDDWKTAAEKGAVDEKSREKTWSDYESLPSAAINSELTYAKQLADADFLKEVARPKSKLNTVDTIPKSILTSTETSLRPGNKSSSSYKVSFRSGVGDTSSVLRRESEKRMLGYDWIAALMDNDQDVMAESEAYFQDLKEFRRLNRDECSNQIYTEDPLSLTDSSDPPPVAKAISDTKVKPYMINDRLFPVPIKKGLLSELDNDNSKGTRGEKEKPPTIEEPRFVRVSIPRSTLQSPHKFKPHRRRSFDPTDSCGLTEHCLLGWDTSRPASIPPASNLGISDATPGLPAKLGTTLAAAERIAESYEFAAFPRAPVVDPFPAWRRNYQDSVMNMSTANTTQQTQGSYQDARQATTDLLNSTYSMMYEMQRLKQARSQEPLPRAQGVN